MAAPVQGAQRCACLGLSCTGGARHIVSLRASELSSGSQGPPNRPLPHEKCHEPPGVSDTLGMHTARVWVNVGCCCEKSVHVCPVVWYGERSVLQFF